jgi:hypothetical protein
MEKIIAEEVDEKLLSTVKIPPRPAVMEEINRENGKDDPGI